MAGEKQEINREVEGKESGGQEESREIAGKQQEVDPELLALFANDPELNKLKQMLSNALNFSAQDRVLALRADIAERKNALRQTFSRPA